MTLSGHQKKKRQVQAYTRCTCSTNTAELLHQVRCPDLGLKKGCVSELVSPLYSLAANSPHQAHQAQTWRSKHAFSPDSGLYLEFHWGCEDGSEVWTGLLEPPVFGPTFRAVLLEIPMPAPSHLCTPTASSCGMRVRHWAAPWRTETSCDSHWRWDGHCMSWIPTSEWPKHFCKYKSQGAKERNSQRWNVRFTLLKCKADASESVYCHIMGGLLSAVLTSQGF